jgi:ABC-2 type transport system permease protein
LLAPGRCRAVRGSATIVRTVVIAVSLPRRRIFGAIVWRDYLTKRSYRLAFATDVFNGLLTLTVYYFISRFFAHPDRAALYDAPSYFAFATVGILVVAMVTSGSVELVTRLREEQLAGTLETLVGNPVSPGELCLGLVGFPFSFALVRALVYFAIVSAVIGIDLRQVSWIGLILVLLATTAAFAGIALAAAATVLVFKRVDAFVGLIIGVLVVFSGSVFPLSSLPEWLQPIARVLPPQFAFDGVRNALFRGEGWVLDAVALLGIAAVGIPVAVAIFGRALRAAQRSGSLGEY